MRKPSVFVSSTCYDLKQLRADLYQYLENAGFDPVLSEYHTFPVDPDTTTIANCRKAVENRADIFVLVVGGRYGSTNQDGKSITNVEYLTARAKGIPVYVFAMRSILDVLPVWRENPEGRFASIVDSPKLFEFVASVLSGGEKWVFPFDTAQEIVGVLRTQLAYLFADALELRMRACQSGALADQYKHLSGRELRLMIERPREWEYRLFSEALCREVANSEDLRRDWSYNLSLGQSISASPSELLTFIRRKNDEAMRIFNTLNALLNDALPRAFGPPGQAGEPDFIVYVANRVGAVYRAALQWKLDYWRVSVDEHMQKLRALAACLCDNAITEVEKFADDLSKRLEDALNRPEGTKAVIELRLVLTVPDQTELTEELARINVMIQNGELEWH